MSKNYTIIGLMSGSSLDGLDIACCHFSIERQPIWRVVDWKIQIAETVPFPPKWIARLQGLPIQSALNFAKTHTYFGHYMGELVNNFIQKHQLAPDFIASHGHTIFHDPDRRLTTQIGDGAALAAITKTTTICDFRTQDIALNGEGTPIAPAVEKHLLQGYDFYLNIGGIANITAILPTPTIAFDIAPANQILNALAEKLGQEFDKDGELARSGQCNEDLLDLLNEIDYFEKSYPKSIANDWIKHTILPGYLDYPCSWEDKLYTACEHLAIQIAGALEKIINKEKIEKQSLSMLATGGGVFNTFLMERIGLHIQKIGDVKIVVPATQLINYKEALLMALMGLLRIEQQPNCFESVTNAKRDTIGGAIYIGE